MAVYFKPNIGSGDKGRTSLLSGGRVPKSDIRIKSLGALDELNCLLGIIRSGVGKRRLKEEMLAVQNNLLLISSAVAGLDAEKAVERETGILEKEIRVMSEKAGPVREFIVPGRKKTSALIHMARAKARSCEILLWEAKRKAEAVYLNRLADYFFLLALLEDTGKK